MRLIYFYWITERSINISIYLTLNQFLFHNLRKKNERSDARATKLSGKIYSHNSIDIWYMNLVTFWFSLNTHSIWFCGDFCCCYNFCYEWISFLCDYESIRKFIHRKNWIDFKIKGWNLMFVQKIKTKISKQKFKFKSWHSSKNYLRK